LGQFGATKITINRNKFTAAGAAGKAVRRSTDRVIGTPEIQLLCSSVDYSWKTTTRPSCRLVVDNEGKSMGICLEVATSLLEAGLDPVWEGNILINVTNTSSFKCAVLD
jgi:muramoyltetrapeptide carboxypeptidase LdcA involved in peptidoglycan recycling